MEIINIKIQDLKPYEKNAKIHTEEQIQQIKKSIEQFGMNDPIGIWKDNTIIEGHGRLEALKQLGYTEVPCIRLDHLSDEERKAYTLAHNKLTMNTDFDIDILNDELEDILNIDMTDFGFDFEEEKEIIEDEIPEEKIETDIKKGDIYQLGRHRLMCGDSTNQKDINKLINNNDIKVVFTSPPYNMNANMYDGYNDNLASEEYINFNLKVINNIKKYLKGFLFWNISYNKNSRWEFIEIMYRIIKETGLKFMELIVWDKGHGMPITSKNMLTRKYEDILMVGDEDSIS